MCSTSVATGPPAAFVSSFRAQTTYGEVGYAPCMACTILFGCPGCVHAPFVRSSASLVVSSHLIMRPLGMMCYYTSSTHCTLLIYVHRCSASAVAPGVEIHFCINIHNYAPIGRFVSRCVLVCESSSPPTIVYVSMCHGLVVSNGTAPCVWPCGAKQTLACMGCLRNPANCPSGLPQWLK